jgi:hypothetical protein
MSTHAVRGQSPRRLSFGSGGPPEARADESGEDDDSLDAEQRDTGAFQSDHWKQEVRLTKEELQELLSEVENVLRVLDDTSELHAELRQAKEEVEQAATRAIVVGVAGRPGSGKSGLVNEMIAPASHLVRLGIADAADAAGSLPLWSGLGGARHTTIPKWLSYADSDEVSIHCFYCGRSTMSTWSW